MKKNIEIKNWTAMLDSIDITNKPILHYTSADGKVVLKPSIMETRDNRIDCIDENEGLFEVYHNWELDCIIRGKKFAEWYLQQLLDEDEYYNWNEKDYWEFEF